MAGSCNYHSDIHLLESLQFAWVSGTGLTYKRLISSHWSAYWIVVLLDCQLIGTSRKDFMLAVKRYQISCYWRTNIIEVHFLWECPSVFGSTRLLVLCQLLLSCFRNFWHFKITQCNVWCWIVFMLIPCGCTVGLFTSVNVLQISVVFHAVLVYIYEISYDLYFMQFSFNILSSCIQFISCKGGAFVFVWGQQGVGLKIF